MDERAMRKVRVRYWTNGAVIGSALFVRELAAAVRARRKRLAKGHSPATPPLFAYRRLDPARRGNPNAAGSNHASQPATKIPSPLS